MKILDNSELSVFFFDDALYGWRNRNNSALNSTYGLTAQKKDNIKTQEEVLQKALKVNDSEFECIARIKLYKEAFNICKECYKINDINGLRSIWPLLSKGRAVTFLQNTNGKIIRILIWKILFWIKIKTSEV